MEQDSNGENKVSGNTQAETHVSTSSSLRRSRHPRPTSRQLVLVALGLWLVSIALPGLYFPSNIDDHNFYPGINILLLGWMGALAFVFSWYANPLFLFACIKLLISKRTAWFSAVLAVVLAASMFYYSEIPGSSTELRVYGYGWGAYLWCTAILLLPVAVRVRHLEQNHQYRGMGTLFRDAPGIIWLLVLVVWAGGAFSYGAYQKIIAGKTERERLFDVVFKRGPVCTTPDVVALTSIPLTGALQVYEESTEFISALTSPTTLIEWGIPIVRKGRFEFYRSDSTPEWHLIAGPAEQAVSATLTVNGTYKAIHARLTSPDDKTLAFDATWSGRSSSNPHYCPGYIPGAKEGQPPRALLLSALALPQGEFVPAPRQQPLLEGRQHTDMHASRITTVGKVQRSAITGNISCPDDTGVRHLWLRKANPAELSFVPPTSWNMTSPQPVDVLKAELNNQGSIVFQVQDHFHYTSVNTARKFAAVCSANATFLGYGHVRGKSGPDRLYLEKRSLPDFRKVWPGYRSIAFQRSGAVADTPYTEFHLYSVEENGDSLNITLAYFEKDAEEGDLINVIAELD